MRPQHWLLLVLIAYGAGFALFPPRVVLIADEAVYVDQALAFAQGSRTLPGSLAPPDAPAGIASDYPPGTSLLQAPFVAILGWRGAALLSVLSLVLLTLATQRLLRALDLREELALVVPAFAGALFFGRVAMSDVPNAALVALSLWVLVSSTPEQRARSALAGFAAGATLLFREPTMMLLVPFLAGALARRRVAAVWILGGFALAVAARLAVAQSLFGDPFFMRESGYRFSVASTVANLPVYALILLAMFPLGALLPIRYRGPWRAETVVAFAAYVLMLLSYDYRPWEENGVARGTILASRFMVPALPLLAVMAADVIGRIRGGALLARLTSPRPIATIALLVCAIAFGIHVFARRLESGPFAIADAIARNRKRGAAVVTNELTSYKYFNPGDGRRLVGRSTVTMTRLAQLCRDPNGVQIVFLDRTDTDVFRRDSDANEAFLAELNRHYRVTVRYDQGQGPSLRLRVFDLLGCTPGQDA